MSQLTEEDKEFVENVDAEYYKRVRTSDEYYRRKKLILMNLEKLEAKVAPQAANYDEYTSLRFIVMEKARQKKSIVKSFIKLEDFKRQQDYDTKTSQSRMDGGSGSKDDDFDLLYGLENEKHQETRQKIEQSKRKKGRGLLLSFYEFNEELRIPRLIRAMKVGLRVALVSDAGTPTISDPGHRFVKEAQEEGIAVEPLPGACSVTVGLSASGFPSESYHFGGYLSKTNSDREN